MKKPISVPFEMPKSDDGKYIALLCDDSILKTRRDQLGLSQQQVADMAHIPLKQYQRLETGETDITGTSFRIGISVCTVLLLDPYSFLPDDIKQPNPKTLKPIPMFHTDLLDDLLSPRKSSNKPRKKTGRKITWKDIKTVFANYEDCSLLIPYEILELLGNPKYVQMSWHMEKRRIVLRAAKADEEGALDVPGEKFGKSLLALPDFVDKHNPIDAMGWGDTPHAVEARLVKDSSGTLYILIDLLAAKPADTKNIVGVLLTPERLTVSDDEDEL